MARNIRRVDGKLSMRDGSAWNVELDLSTVELPGQHGVEDEAIARVALVTRGIPNGEYLLDYFCFAHHTERVRVQDGKLLAA